MGGASVHSTTGSRGVSVSGSSAGYTMFRGSVKGTGYPLQSPVSLSLSLPCVTVCHHVSTWLYITRYNTCCEFVEVRTSICNNILTQNWLIFLEIRAVNITSVNVYGAPNTDVDIITHNRHESGFPNHFCNQQTNTHKPGRSGQNMP